MNRLLMPLPLTVAALCASAQTPQEIPYALAVVEHAREAAASEVWPGFDLSAIPIAVYDGERTYLCGHPSEIDGFEPLAGAAGVRVMDGRYQELAANTAIQIDGVWTGSFLLDPSAGKPAEDCVGLVVHECFHAFQQSRSTPWQTANEVQLFEYDLDDAESLALRRVELRALDRALAAPDARSAGEEAAVFVRARERRASRLPAAAMQYERDIERYEGLAEYAGLEAAGHRAPPPPAAGFPLQAFRDRGYFTGPAIAQILDRVAPDWKRDFRAEEKPVLDMLLAHACGSPAGATDLVIDPELLAQARREVDQLAEDRRQALETFLAAPGWTLTISAAEGAPIWPQRFDPFNVRVLGPGEVLHTRWLRVGNDSGVMELLGRPCITEAAGEHPLFNGIRRITITGLAERPAFESQSDRVSLTLGDSIKLDVQGTVSIRSEARQAVVELR